MVITGLTRNQLGSNPPRVRISPSPPKNNRNLYPSCGYFLFVTDKKENPTDNNQQDFLTGRGRRIRTLTNGFGDRCATIDTIPLYLIVKYVLQKNACLVGR